MNHQLRGMTWSHPRGFAPLDRLAQLAGEAGPLHVAAAPVSWDRQSLNGFESYPIAELARRYDLIVLDHPGLGAAVEAGALQPLETLLGDCGPAWRAKFVGRSAASYYYGGHQWAVPIDAATQVGAFIEPPGARTWSEVLDAQIPEWVVPTKSPHTLMVFLGIAAAILPDFEVTADELIPRDIGEVAFAVLNQFIRKMPKSALDMDPIDISEEIASGRLQGSPLIYGYITYSYPAPGRRPVRFVDAPAWEANGIPGSVLGGTGIAISAHTHDLTGAVAHVKQISSDIAQRDVITAAGGQAASVTVWRDTERSDGAEFYPRTLRSQIHAWIRPRYAGWIAFQHQASQMLLEAACAPAPRAAVIRQINALHSDYLRRSPRPGI